MDKEQAIALLEAAAKEAGFDHWGAMDCSTLQLIPEVRDMCAGGKCAMYGKNWRCPPAIGDLDECREKIKGYRWGLLVQTVAELEDSMDYESMQEGQENQKARFAKMYELLNFRSDVLPMSSGTCTKCKKCTYPDEPCRFPEYQYSSMEAYGLLVSQVCKDNGLPYYYGPNTVAYTSCFLIK